MAALAGRVGRLATAARAGLVALRRAQGSSGLLKQVAAAAAVVMAVMGAVEAAAAEGSLTLSMLLDKGQSTSLIGRLKTCCWLEPLVTRGQEVLRPTIPAWVGWMDWPAIRIFRMKEVLL